MCGEDKRRHESAAKEDLHIAHASPGQNLAPAYFFGFLLPRQLLKNCFIGS
jgi:hypothetical protein